MNFKGCDIITNLKSNEEYSYRQICTLKNEPYLHGNSKASQIQKWSKYDLFEKVGTKYKYIRPRTQDEIEVSELNMTYNELLEIFIFNYLSTISDNKLITTIPKLAEILCMRNKNYAYGKYNQNEILFLIEDEKLIPVNNEHITIDNLRLFFERTEPNYHRKIKEIIQKMDAMGLISYNKYLYLGTKSGQYTIMQKATDEQNILLLKIESEILDKFPLREIDNGDGTQKIVKADKTNLTNIENFKFYKQRNKLFLKRLNEDNSETTYSFFYNEYEIFLDSDTIGSHVPYKIKNLKVAMNNKVLKSLKNVNQSFLDWFIDMNTTTDIKHMILEERKN